MQAVGADEFDSLPDSRSGSRVARWEDRAACPLSVGFGVANGEQMLAGKASTIRLKMTGSGSPDQLHTTG